MQSCSMNSSSCITEASQACFHGCSVFLSPHTDTPSQSRPAATFRSDFANSIASSLNQRSPFTNSESLPSLEESLAFFTGAYPQFEDTDQTDRIRAREYYHLSAANHVCLDYIGHGLFSYSQQRSADSVPSTSSSQLPPQSSSASTIPFFQISYKSVNLAAQLTYGGAESEFELKTKKRIMEFMNMSGDDYSVVFTSNQTSAFKLLAESYPFQSNKNLLSVYDHECEAIELMNEAAKKKGACVKSAEFSWPSLRIRSAKLMKTVMGKPRKKKQGLFAFPLQSRVSGSRYSYSWMAMAQEKGWHVLLDACALGPKAMETLGLSLFKPDFLICTFYKVFGENPSGFACLFVKKTSARVLQQQSSSPSIGIVSLHPPSSSTRPEDSEESGSISASEIVQPETPFDSVIEFRGLDHADTLGLILISTRGRYLINWLVNALLSLKHPDSETPFPLVRIYGPRVKFDRGPALSFNVFDWKGERIEPTMVQKLADRFGISLGYSFLHNVWLSDHEFRERERAVGLQGFEVTRKRIGRMCVVTASLGLLADFEDVYRVWTFVSRFLDADFVEKERWRYTALNQQLIEV